MSLENLVTKNQTIDQEIQNKFSEILHLQSQKTKLEDKAINETTDILSEDVEEIVKNFLDSKGIKYSIPLTTSDKVKTFHIMVKPIDQ